MGLAVPLSKGILSYTQPFFLSSARLLLAGIYIAWRNRRGLMLIRSRSTGIYSLYARSIFFGFFIKYICKYWSLRYITASKMAFLFNSTPFIVAFLSYMICNERLTIRQWCGVAIGFIGTMPLICESGMILDTWFCMPSLPEVVLLIAISAHCYGVILTQQLLRETQEPLYMVHLVQVICGGILCLLCSLWYEGYMPITSVIPVSIGLCALIVLRSICCQQWQLRIIQRYSVTFIALLDYSSPFFSALYGVLFLAEQITWHYGVSALLVFISVRLFYQDERESGYNAQVL